MKISIESGDWDRLRGEAAVIRFGVFVVEQNVPEELELDLLDDSSRHWLARNQNGEVVGTARLTPDHHIGRMAVLADYRGRGIGRGLVRAIQQHARDNGIPQLSLNAQTYAIPFYEKLGFRAEGAEFLDAGILHRTMHWRTA
ncbi:MAG: GNAT family N-acetyltransferase [Aquisalimonadaceae bacterium]